MNLSVVCRTCLTDVKKEPVGLTEALYNFLENDLKFHDVPRTYPNLDLPINVCLSCYRSLVSFERFYIQCRNAQEFLKSQIKSKDIQLQEHINHVNNALLDGELSDNEVLENDNDHDAIDAMVIEYSAVRENDNCEYDNSSEKVEQDKDYMIEYIEDAQPYTDEEEQEDNYIYKLDESIIADNLVESQSNEEPVEKKAKFSALHVCKTCGKEFNGKADLRKHEMTHPGVRPFVCKVCNDAFKDRTAINYHMTTHYGKIFSCTICDKKCATRSMLRSHARYSHGCQNFQCEECGEVFKTGHLLTSHKTKHTGTQQYVCKFCNNEYYNRHDLLKHIKHVHIYYNCNFCNKTYKKLIR